MRKKQPLLKKVFLNKQITDLDLAPSLVTTSSDVTVLEALEIMSRSNVGSILVVDNKKLVGMFTERDLITRIACLTVPPKEKILADFMTHEPETLSIKASLARGVYALASGGYRHIPLVGRDKELVNILSIKDIIKYVHAHITKKIGTADSNFQPADSEVDYFFYEDLSMLEPYPVQIVQETDSLEVGMKALCASVGGSVLIQDDKGVLSGIYTERDYLNKVVLENTDFQEVRMARVMTVTPKTLLFNASVASAMSTMSEGNFRHLPVMDIEEKVMGMISARVLFTFLSERIVAALTPEEDGE